MGVSSWAVMDGMDGMKLVLGREHVQNVRQQSSLEATHLEEEKVPRRVVDESSLSRRAVNQTTDTNGEVGWGTLWNAKRPLNMRVDRLASHNRPLSGLQQPLCNGFILPLGFEDFAMNGEDIWVTQATSWRRQWKRSDSATCGMPSYFSNRFNTRTQTRALPIEQGILRRADGKVKSYLEAGKPKVSHQAR